MDEPLLGGSTTYPYTKKSEHPFLSLFSPRGSRSPEGFDPFLQFSSLPRSPGQASLPTSPSTHLSAGGLNTPYRRSETFGGRPSLPRLVVSDPVARASNFWNSAGLSPRYQGQLFRIAEEAGPPLSSSSVFSPNFDLEAPKNDLKDDDGTEETSRRIGEDSKIYDEEKVQTGRRLLSRVSAVYHELSSSPDHDYFGCPTCRPHQHTVEEHDSENHPISNDTNEFPRPLLSVATAPDLGRLDTGEQGGASPESPGENSGGDSGDGSLRHAGAGSGSERRSIHRAKTAPMLVSLSKCQRKEKRGANSKDSPNQAVSSIVRQAFVGLCIYLTVGVILFSWKREEFSRSETVTVVDGLYFCIVTMCTIGYGDIVPVSPSAKLLACILMFVGFGFVDALLSGMLTFVLDRQEHLVLTVVGDGHHERARNYLMDSKKGRMRIRMKVALAVGTVLMTIFIGVVFLHFFEELHWIDSLYVTCISITTVGYGDYSFKSLWGRLFAAVWLLLSTLGVARAFLFLAEARVHSRHRHLAKRILEKKMKADDLLEVDLDNDGHVCKSEFVVYKLREMGKIEQSDVVEICNQFDVIDSISAGKITFGQLKEAEG